MPDLDAARAAMVERQLARRGIRDERVLAAMASVPRELFVPGHARASAYEDRPLSIGRGQTISQPYIVALMAEALALEPTDRVLEVGTGSGYAAAVLSRIVERVFTIERHATLARRAAAVFAELDYRNVQVRHGDGTNGWPEHAPFDGISVTAAGPTIPDALLRQLAAGGRLVMPVGRDLWGQRLVVARRVGVDEFAQGDLGSVAFVPLIGDTGWGS